jgi:hypothetical protein
VGCSLLSHNIILFKWTSHGKQQVPVLNLTLSRYILGSSFCKHSQQRGRCVFVSEDWWCLQQICDLDRCQQQDLNNCAVQLQTRDWLSNMKCKHSLFRQLVINLFSLWTTLLTSENNTGKLHCTQSFNFSSLVSKKFLIVESTQFTLLFNSKHPLLKEWCVWCSSNRIIS